jgi:hypothetical protein
MSRIIKIGAVVAEIFAKYWIWFIIFSVDFFDRPAQYFANISATTAPIFIIQNVTPPVFGAVYLLKYFGDFT